MVSRNYYLKRKLQGLLFLGCVLGVRFSFQKRSRKTKSLVNFILSYFKFIKILSFHYDIVLQLESPRLNKFINNDLNQKNSRHIDS